MTVYIDTDAVEAPIAVEIHDGPPDTAGRRSAGTKTVEFTFDADTVSVLRFVDGGGQNDVPLGPGPGRYKVQVPHDRATDPDVSDDGERVTFRLWPKP